MNSLNASVKGSYCFEKSILKTLVHPSLQLTSLHFCSRCIPYALGEDRSPQAKAV